MTPSLHQAQEPFTDGDVEICWAIGAVMRDNDEADDGKIGQAGPQQTLEEGRRRVDRSRTLLGMIDALLAKSDKKKSDEDKTRL